MAKKKVVKEVIVDTVLENIEVEAVIENVEVAIEIIGSKVEELLDIQNQLNSKPNSDQRSILLARQTALQKK